LYIFPIEIILQPNISLSQDFPTNQQNFSIPFWTPPAQPIFSGQSSSPNHFLPQQVILYHTFCILVSTPLSKNAYFSLNVYLFLDKFLRAPDDFLLLFLPFPNLLVCLHASFRHPGTNQIRDHWFIIYCMVYPRTKHKTEGRFYVHVHLHFLHCKIMPKVLSAHCLWV